MERFIGVLIEHFAGEFPLWLAPIQVVVLPITDGQLDYAKQLVEQFRAARIRVELDDRNEKINRKIRDWETRKVPYMLVVGEKEKASNTVAVRQHRKGDLGTMAREAFLNKVVELIQLKSLTI
jgi:threonyl-tRNA synthetase